MTDQRSRLAGGNVTGPKPNPYSNYSQRLDTIVLVFLGIACGISIPGLLLTPLLIIDGRWAILGVVGLAILLGVASMFVGRWNVKR